MAKSIIYDTKMQRTHDLPNVSLSKVFITLCCILTRCTTLGNKLLINNLSNKNVCCYSRENTDNVKTCVYVTWSDYFKCTLRINTSDVLVVTYSYRRRKFCHTQLQIFSSTAVNAWSCLPSLSQFFFFHYCVSLAQNSPYDPVINHPLTNLHGCSVKIKG